MQTSQNNILSLRETLFKTLRALDDKENPMDLDRAKAICETSQTIINSVKIEIDFAKVTGLHTTSNFIPSAEVDGISHPALGITVHKIKK